MEKAFCCFASSGKDFARFAKLFKNKGRWNGKQIIDSSFVNLSLKPRFKNSQNEIDISIEESNDNRSYHINSEKAFDILGFKTKYTIENAVVDICNSFKKNKIKNLFDDINYFNVKKLKHLNIK